MRLKVEEREQRWALFAFNPPLCARRDQLTAFNRRRLDGGDMSQLREVFDSLDFFAVHEAVLSDFFLLERPRNGKDLGRRSRTGTGTSSHAGQLHSDTFGSCGSSNFSFRRGAIHSNVNKYFSTAELIL